MRTQVRRACGHCSTGPSAVVDQSSARIRVAISPFPTNTDSIKSRLLDSIFKWPIFILPEETRASRPPIQVRSPLRRVLFCSSERKAADQLNLARGAGGCQDLAGVSGEITRRILEDGIPRSPQEKRTLCITRDTKIRVVEHVISFHPNRNLPLLCDRKMFVDRRVELRERRPPQDVSSGIAKLTGRRDRKSAWIKPARWSAHSGPIRTASHVRVADQVRTLRNNQRLDIGIVEVEHWCKWYAAMNARHRRDLPAPQETSASRQIVTGICHEVIPNVKIRRAPASLAIENVLRRRRIIHGFHRVIHRGIVDRMR